MSLPYNGPMTKHVSFLIKPASSACGMRCRYCFYRDVADHREQTVAPRMTPETSHAIIDKAFALAPDAQVTFAFQGGEPTVAGLPFFRDFIAHVDERRERQQVTYTIQTNGLAVAADPAWTELFAERRFLVGVSVDGSRQIHDHLRPDVEGHGTYARVARAIRRLRGAGVDFNVLTVLTSELARHPQQAFGFLLREKVDYVQYIPCLPSLGEGTSPWSLAPHAFAGFYRALLDQWLRELARGHYISVGLFDDIMAMSLGRMPVQCGMLGQCAPQLVVEGNGDVYPCDFYALDEWRCGNVRTDSLEDLVSCDAVRRFLAELRRPCSACANCPFEGMCHRNCKRLNVVYYDEEYCGYREFLEYGYDRLAYAAQVLAG